MSKQKLDEWILQNKSLIFRAIKSSNLNIKPADYKEYFQNACCAVLSKAKYYNGSKGLCKFSSYMFSIIRRATIRYFWKNNIPVSISYGTADYIISEILKRRFKNNGALTEEDYNELKDKKFFGKETINIIEGLIDETPYSEDACELMGLRSRQSIDKYEEKINQEYLSKDLMKHLEKLPEAYQRALCEKYSLPIPEKHSPDTSGSKCNNKYHLACTGLKKLREMYKDKNIGDYIDD